MRYEDLIGHFGGLTKAAEALGLDRRVVHAWRKRRIPSRWQLKAESLSDGVLRADDEARDEAVEYASYAERLRRVAA
jgi:hypothetical protein